MTRVFVVPNHTDCTVITFVWNGIGDSVTVNRWSVLAWAVAVPAISSDDCIDPWPLVDAWPIPVVMNTLPETWCVVDPVGKTWTFPEMIPLHTEAEALTEGRLAALHAGERESERESMQLSEKDR